MTAPKIEKVTPHLKALQIANFLSLKAITTKNRESLVFIILNDTVRMIRYDRALLWDLGETKPKLLGISGESKINKSAPLVQKWSEAVQNIKYPSKAQILTFSAQAQSQPQEAQNKATMLWLPISVDGRVTLGLWLELWNIQQETTPPQEMINLLMNFLMPAYGAAWEKFYPKYFHQKSLIRRVKYFALASIVLLVGLFVQIPLRIVAPCEVVPKQPYLITAPLEGIIEEIHVQPGDTVKEGELLFEYDKRVPMQKLEVARKNVEILQSEVKRASTLGLEDPTALTELAIFTLKLQKGKSDLALAEYYANRLRVVAPEKGLVMIDNPDEWRGKPVRVGEKIIAITDPKRSKIRIWLAENDNIQLNMETPITVFLNIDPGKNRKAKITYIASESLISDKHIPSFVAEAEWIDPQNDIKLGLKGTAILYGEKVPLFYFILRKPWATIRNFFGV